MWKAGWLLCGVLGLTHIASAQIKPTLSLDFEGDVNAVGSDGKTVAPRVDGKVELVDGRFGKAFKSGPATGGYLHFPTKGIVSAASGTVEMWVCPLDWDGTEKRFHVFFDARGDGALYLYKFYTGGLLMLSAPTLKGPFHSASADISTWKPGEWHHIAGTWSPYSQAVYIDGKKIGSAAPNLPGRLDSEFMLGDNPWTENIGTRTSNSLIDRVRIYDRILSDEHIAAHAAGDYDKIVQLSPASIKLDFTIDPVAKKLTARAAAIGVDLAADAGVTFSLSQGTTNLSTTAPQPFGQGFTTTQISLAALKPGSYQLAATIRSGELAVTTEPQTVTIPAMEWLGNKLGLEHKVLPPWTPLKVTSRQATSRKVSPRETTGAPLTVACWGRTYQFANIPLPSQIVSAGQPLLQRPVTLNLAIGGQTLRWTKGSIRVVSASPTDVDLAGSATAVVPGGAAGTGGAGVGGAAVAGGTIELNTRLHLEYDGMMLVNLDLRVPDGVKVDSVSLDIPVQKARALYRHRWSPQWTGASGNVPAENGVVDQSDFIPFAWLGDNDRGLFWFCESGQQWPNYEAKNAFETVRDNEAVTLRFNLLAKGQSLPSKGQTLPANWQHQFGIQATPVKAIPHDWRKWRLNPAVRGNIDIIWPAPPKISQASLRHFGSPMATDPTLFKKRVDELHAKGTKVVPYSWLTFLADDVPEWKWFESQWKTGNPDTSGTSSWGSTWEGVSPYAKTFSDYVIWRNHEAMQRYKLDGYYHDQSHPYPYYNEQLNLGWRDATGKLHPIYPILAYRDLYRRLYAMVKTEKSDAFLMAHMSGKITIPFLAYEDTYLDGENFRGVVKDSYMDIVGLDYWRAELMGRQWGLAPYFLPEFDAEHAAQVEPSRGLIALLMLHDIGTWSLWNNPKVFDEAFDALDAFGYVDSDFIPYFDPVPPATTDMKDVYISVYKRRDGRALAVVANTSREDRNGTLTLNAKRIGLPLDNVLSWPDKKAVQRRGARVTLEVPRLGYRLLLIGKMPK